MACMKEDLSESDVKIEFDFKVRELSYVFWKKIDAELITKRQYQTVETEITFEQAVLQFGMSLHKISKEYDLLKRVSNPQDDIISVSLLPYSITAYIDRAKGSFSILAPHVSPWEADYTQWKSALDFIQVYLEVDLSPLEKEVQEIKNKLYLNAKAALIVGTTIKSLCDSFLPKKNWDYQLDQQCLKSEIILKTSEGIFYDIEMYHKPFSNNAKLLIDLLNNPHEEFIADTVSCQILTENLKEMKAAIKESFFKIKQISKTIQSSMLWRCKMAKKRRRRRPNEYGELYSKYYFCTQPSFLEIRLGYALIPLVDKECGAELLEEITKVRNKIDAEYGITIPKISIHDDMNNEPYEYAIYLYGNRICSGEIRMGYTMCLNLGAVEPSDKEVKADKAIDPVYGNAGYWIPADTPEEKELENLGYVLVEPAGIIREHLEKIIKENTTKILNQSLVNLLINKVRPSNPDVIDDIFFNHQFPTSSMKKVLNLLLSEKYSIRDMNTILETIADNISQSQNLEFLVEKIKEQLPEPVVEKD